MGTFQSAKTFRVTVADLSPVANDVTEHFQNQGYEVTGEETITNGWYISIHKGGLFKSVLGMKTALNIELQPSSQGISAKADVGVFGLQAIPTAIMLFVAWPVLLTQIWGLIKQSKLDEEALTVIENSLTAHSLTSFTASTVAAASEIQYCSQCGTQLQPSCKFCPQCGTKLA